MLGCEGNTYLSIKQNTKLSIFTLIGTSIRKIGCSRFKDGRRQETLTPDAYLAWR